MGVLEGPATQARLVRLLPIRHHIKCFRQWADEAVLQYMTRSRKSLSTVVSQDRLPEASVAGAEKVMRVLLLQLGISISMDIWVVLARGIREFPSEAEDRSLLQRPTSRA